MLSYMLHQLSILVTAWAEWFRRFCKKSHNSTQIKHASTQHICCTWKQDWFSILHLRKNTRHGEVEPCHRKFPRMLHYSNLWATFCRYLFNESHFLGRVFSDSNHKLHLRKYSSYMVVVLITHLNEEHHKTTKQLLTSYARTTPMNATFTRGIAEVYASQAFWEFCIFIRLWWK